MKPKLIFLSLFFSITTIYSQNDQHPVDPDTAYTRVLIERVNKFLPKIVDVNDSVKYIRVRDIIIEQYKDLSKIHDTRDERVNSIRAQDSLDKETMNKQVDAVKDEAVKLMYYLHFAFLAKLSSELTYEQIDEVKNGMTYGVLPLTYNAYLELLPELTEEQKKQIMMYLIEARELAMDAGSSQKKHHIFGKYKGKINNYLSAEGYDLKKAEEDLIQRKRIDAGN